MIPIVYNLRSLRVRKATTIAAALGLALVVFVFASARMLSNGISRALNQSSDPSVAIVLRKSANAELESVIDRNSVPLIATSPGVASYPDGRPQAVGEVVAVALLHKRGTEGGLANVLIRGVPPDVFAFRPSVKMVVGRAAAPGTDEVVVGRAIAGRFDGLDLGQSFEIRRHRAMTIVGVFADGGAGYESEVWGDADRIAASFGRGPTVSSVRVRLESPDKLDSFAAAVATNRQLNMTAMREADFFARTSRGTATFIGAMGLVIALLFSLGAIIGAMITMHATVAHRQREIGTLRAIGFTRLQILTSFLLESVVLALLGGILGAAASLLMSLQRFSTINLATFSEIVFQFKPSVSIVVSAIVGAAVMGILGGLWPALRAARMDPVEAMRGA